MARLAIALYTLLTLLSLIKSEIRFAFEMFRHGARTPYNEMTSDFKDWFGEKWSGVKELTGVGLRQHYLLGFRNRQRFIIDNKLLSEQFDPREIYIISTDTNRTLLSASAQLQGLYPPGKGPLLLNDEQVKNAVPPNNPESFQEEKEALNYMALPNQMNVLPIHTFFLKERTFQLQDKKYCPGTKEFYKKNEERKEVVDFLNEFTATYKTICGVIAKENNCFKNYTLAYSVLDAIISAYTDNRDMAILRNPELGIDIDDLVKKAFQFFYLDFVGNGIDSDTEIGKVAMTPTMRKIIDWMDLKIKNDGDGKKDYQGYDSPRFVMYSAHDTSVGAFEAFMKAAFNVDIIYAEFASNVHLELHLKPTAPQKPTVNDYTVQYLFGDDLIKEMPYEEFKSQVKKTLKTDEEIKAFCKWPEPEKPGFNYFIILTAVFGVACAFLIGFIVHLCINKPKYSSLDSYNTL